jgi:hypothetical protein
MIARMDGRLFLRPPPRVIDGREMHRALEWERLVPAAD